MTIKTPKFHSVESKESCSGYGPAYFTQQNPQYSCYEYPYRALTGQYPYAHGISQFAFGLTYDIYEEKDHLAVEVPFPGLVKDSLEVTVENRWLRIRGQTEQAGCTTHRNVILNQVPKGAFDQTILLPEELDPTSTQAVFTNGILSVRIKKARLPHTIHNLVSGCVVSN